MTGGVPDVRPFVARPLSSSCRCVWAAARGSRSRGTLDEEADGLDSLGCEGIDVKHEEHLLIADKPSRFARAVLRLWTSRPRRQRSLQKGTPCAAPLSMGEVTKQLEGCTGLGRDASTRAGLKTGAAHIAAQSPRAFRPRSSASSGRRCSGRLDRRRTDCARWPSRLIRDRVGQQARGVVDDRVGLRPGQQRSARRRRPRDAPSCPASPAPACRAKALLPEPRPSRSARVGSVDISATKWR